MKAMAAVRRGAWLALVGVALLGIVGGADSLLTWARYRPLIAALADSVPEMTAYMQRRAEEGRPPEQRRWVPLDSLPAVLVCAVLAAENVRFFTSGTLDWSNQRAMMFRVLQGDLSRGGSGIAQQLARNLFLAPDRTLRRKLREYVLAYQISHTLSKERQIELYLNLVEWGEGIWGVAAGSEHLFARPPGELTSSEMVLLANVLPAPFRGLAFPISPPRRAKLDLVTEILWRETILDDLAWTATAARLRRMGDFVDAGMTPAAAARAVTDEMGPERMPEVEPDGRLLLLRRRCDPTRRGVT
jgi:monofunctional glycosyltransferase